MYFGSECDGRYAEYTRVRADNAIVVSSQLSDAELATFPCAYTTREGAIRLRDASPGYNLETTGTPALETANGKLYASNEPGLGVDPDFESLG